jgi:thiol-disulfide isomerase/thioredoxin
MTILGVLPLVLLLARHGDPLPEGAPAPRIEALSHDGRAFGADFEGRITLVDFFATWCPHCRDSLAGHDRLMAAFGDRVRLVIVDVEEDPALVRAFFARRRPPAGAELYFDRSGLTSRLWKVTGFPTLYLVDRAGVIRYATSGYDDGEVPYLAKLITDLENGDRPAGRSRKRGRAGAATTVTFTSEDARARAMGVEIIH